MRLRRSPLLVFLAALSAGSLAFRASAQEPSPVAPPVTAPTPDAVPEESALRATPEATPEAVPVEAPPSVAPGVAGDAAASTSASEAPAAAATEGASTISTRSFEGPADGAAPVAVPPGAHGLFRSKDLEFELADGYAFRSEEFLVGGKTVALAISNASFNAEFIDQYHDRRALIDQYFVDEETAVVYFLFSPTGAFQGYSYELEPGNGCGYCEDPSVVSTVRLADSRLIGTLKLDTPERSFDLAVDLPVASDDFGEEQGTTGGASGGAYLRIHSALTQRDQNALQGLLTAERLAEWNQAKAASPEQGEIFFASLADAHPASFRIARAFENGDRALLLVVGTSPDGPVRGEALLRKEKGTWRLQDEVYRRVPGN